MDSDQEVFTYLFKIDLKYTYNPDTENFTFKEIENDSFKKFLVEHDIKFSDSNQIITIRKHSLPFGIFINWDEFKSKVSASSFKSDFFIINYETKSIFYNNNKKKFYLDFSEEFPQIGLFNNIKTYYDALIFFKSKAFLPEERFDFIDSINSASREFTFISFEDKIKVKVKYLDVGIPDLKSKKNFDKDLHELKEMFNGESKHMPKFLKSAIIHNLYNFDQCTFSDLLKTLKSILNETKKNFNVYLHDLSIKNIKREYEEYKKKYFEEQNSILSKLTNQTLALPISLGGATLLIFELKESPIAVIIILAALFVFGYFLSSFLQIFHEDITRLEDVIKADFKKLKQNEFFKIHKSELTHFEESVNWISRRSFNLKSKFIGFYYALWFFNFTILGYSLNLSYQDLDGLIFYSAIVLLILFSIQSKLFK